MELRTAPIPSYSWLSRTQSFGLAVVFCAALAIPAVGWYFGWQGRVLGGVLRENRNLAPPPDFRSTSLKDWPARIDAYYEDHVGFRTSVIRLSGSVLHQWMGESSSEVIIGKPPAPGEPQWYFWAAEGILDDRLGFSQLTPPQLAAWRTRIEHRARWLKARGIAYLLVVAPEKSSLYPELLPDYLESRVGSTRLQQLIEYLRDSRLPFLDLTNPLRDAKSHGTLFYPFDTHWNGRAVYYGYAAIMNALRTQKPELAAGRLGEDFEVRMGSQETGGDLASILGVASTAPAPVLAYRKAAPNLAATPWPPGLDPSMNFNRGTFALETPTQHGRLLVFHDSFFAAPLASRESQPLAAHFGRSYFAWIDPSDAAFERFVEMEHPDVVVEEHGERVLRNIPPPPAPSEPATPRLRRTGGPPSFAIERFNGRRARADGMIVKERELRIEGWAIDASSVEIVIDGLPFPAAYGLEGSRAFQQIGFLADLSLVGWSPGEHEVGIRVISPDGAGYREAIWGRLRIE